jgi:carbon-monoxide dehydrogenase small subunit
VSARIPITVTVNGTVRAGDVAARQLLVYYLREELGLTGTKVGCDTSSCGACTVLLNGESVKSCTILAVQVDGEDITTVEGLAPDGELHPVQAAFREHHALQCGYCTPGMVLAVVSLLREEPGAGQDVIRRGLEGNLCRCTGYTPIVAAARSVAARDGGAA